MATNEFVAVATEGVPNVQPLNEYTGSTEQRQGYAVGQVPSSESWNRMLRQGTFIAAGVAQFVANVTGEDVLDDGDLDAFVALLTAAAGSGGGRIITAAGPQTLLVSDSNVFINQAVAAAIQVKLPAEPAAFQEITVFDDKGDAAANNITVNGNGNAIANCVGDNYVMNQNYMAVTFKWNGTAWRVKCKNI